MTSEASGSWGCGACTPSMVPDPLGPILITFVDSREGTDPDSPRLRSLGHRLGRPPSNLSLRQPGGSVRPQIAHGQGIMHLIRCLVFIEAKLGFYVVPTYINTKALTICHVTISRHSSRRSQMLTKTQRLRLPSVQHYFRSGLGCSTQSSYRAGLKRFYDFCVRYNISTTFPVTEQILCYFLAFLADQGLAPKTGQSYLSAVHSMQISLGFPDPRDHSSMPILKRVQAGIRRVRAL